jgi:hypothetical protein
MIPCYSTLRERGCWNGDSLKRCVEQLHTKSYNTLNKNSILRTHLLKLFKVANKSAIFY